uniref:Uncharacterized protein n=1 Tax=Cacopsylla melanoneura TaxID=428564 RepID=A0A8D8Y3G4_9HEMI
MDNCYLIILLSWCSLSIANGLNDITTVYEINTLKSDLEEVKYLNTCTVSVHVPAVAKQLPLFSSNSNGSISGTNIPPLYSRPTLTKWKRLDGRELLTDDFMKEQMLNFKQINMNLPPLSHLLTQTLFNWIKVQNSEPVYNESYMNAFYNNNSTLPYNTLMVTFHTFEPTRTQLYWDSNDSHLIEITTRNGNNITVCYYNEKTECKEYIFSFGYNAANNSRILITLFGEFIISDVHGPQILYTNFHLPKGFTQYTGIKHVHDGIWSLHYFLYQAIPTHIVSPWLEMKNRKRKEFN